MCHLVVNLLIELNYFFLPCLGLDVPSGIFKLLIESHNLPWFCRYYPDGCREIFEETDLEIHQQDCVFRRVNCPYLRCERDPKVKFKDITDHIEDSDEHGEDGKIGKSIV